MNNLLLLFFLLSTSILTYSQLYINEFLSSNTYINYDPDNTQFVDWIEIYNDESTDINIGGYYLTDDSLDTQKWLIPANTIISANGYYIFWADKLDTNNHTNFGLSRNGEFIGLYTNNGDIVDKLVYHQQEADISYGRNKDNLSEWGFFFKPTPNSINNTQIYTNTNRALPPNFSIQGGIYSGTQSVNLSTVSPTAEIRYTLDGTNPLETSALYTSSLNFDTITNLRARCFDTGTMPSEVITNSYLINVSHSLPVISITTEPKNFYNDTIGIYCIGTNGVTQWNVTANFFHRDWERPANIEFFEEDGTQVINQLSGIAISGGRRKMGQKSLKIFAKNKYGNPIYNYDFFNNDIDNYQSLVLRNGGFPDYSFSLIRDNLAQEIVSERTDIDVQGSRQSVVYVNGEYFGIYSIKEKLNEDYLVSHRKINPSNINMLENATAGIIEGSNDEYLYLLNTLRNNNVNELYEFIDDNIDISEYIDYLSSEIYMGNRDWPIINIKFWKEKTEFGKWKWMMYDFDVGFNLWSGWEYDMIEHAFDDDATIGQNPPASTEFARLIIKNDSIKNNFLQSFAAHANTTFSPARILPIIDSMKTEMESEMPNHIARWKDYIDPDEGACVQSVVNWENQINHIIYYANHRWDTLRQHAINWFNLDGDINLTTTSNNGEIFVYNVSLNQGTNTGKFFQNVPIKFKAVPKLGYKFAHWEGASTSTNANIELTLAVDTTLNAIFEIDNKTILPTNIIGVDTLYYNQSPYIGIADLTIQAGGHLYVEAGVEVFMPKNTSMYVYGKLEVAGTEQNPVLFDVNSQIGDKNWGALCFYNSSDSSVINYLQIKNTTTGENQTLQKAAISSFNSTVIMNNIDISDCCQPVYAEGGNIYLYNSKLRCQYTCDNINVKYANNAVVENCDIKGNESPDTDGIDFDNTTNGLIKNNKVYSFNGFNSDAIDVGEGANVIVENNLIFNCTDKGISVGQASQVIVKNNVICNCDMGLGIKDSLSFAQIENNTIYNTNYGIVCFEKNYLHGGGTANVVNTIISASNTSPIMLDDKSHITISYSCSDTEPLTGVGNINIYPFFVNIISFNFELQTTSACINTGDPSFPNDYDGTTIDMGAYYNFSSEINNSIVINEINYRSDPMYDAGDWIELYNNSGKDVDMSGWIFSDEKKQHLYKLPDGFVLKSYDFIVLTNSWLQFVEQYPSVTKFRGDFDFSFNNNGEMLKLYDAKMNLVDFVEYSHLSPWPILAGGQMPTLELIEPNLDNNLGQNWSAYNDMGTPGEVNNTVYVNTPDNTNDLVLYPNPTNNFFTVNVSAVSRVIIYSTDGTEIADYCNYNGGVIDVSSFKTGVYIVKILLNNKTINKKIIIL